MMREAFRQKAICWRPPEPERTDATESKPGAAGAKKAALRLILRLRTGVRAFGTGSCATVDCISISTADDRT